METIIDKALVRSILHTRKADSHKGDYGRALLVAGSKGMMGAALLSARACMRSGVGLLTTRVPECGYNILQLGIPESKCDCDTHPLHHTTIEVPALTDAIAIGPGLGTHEDTQKAVYEFLMIENNASSLVLDADSLNILAMHRQWLELLPQGTIITPHPGEMSRLGIEPTELVSKYGLIVVLKGHVTRIFTPDGTYINNEHGNAGMAVGGSGDVLTGIILALLAQHYTPTEAAVVGVWIHSFAGDLALDSVHSMESLLPSDIIDHLGVAFKETREK